jgi:hypothetical protein
MTFSRAPLLKIQRRHAPALQALELLYQVVDNPAVLTELGYSDAQTASAVSFFSEFLGANGLLLVEPDAWNLREAADLRAHRQEEAPFTVQLMFLLLSRHFPLLALAECITAARFGCWSIDRRIFFPTPLPAGPGGIRWGMRTASARELGHVLVSFTGSVIDAVRFEEAWPEARFREGKHFMDKRFRLPLVEGSISVFQTVRRAILGKANVASLFREECLGGARVHPGWDIHCSKERLANAAHFSEESPLVLGE